MSSKRRLKSSVNKVILSVSSIMIFSLMGISYASWDSVLNIKAKVSTADLHICFDNAQEDSWSAVINNSTINNYISNCHNIEWQDTQYENTLYMHDFQVDTSSPIYLLFRLSNNGTLPIKMDESHLTINGNNPSLEDSVVIQNLISGNNNISTTLGSRVYNSIDGIQVYLYYPTQDILPYDEEFKCWGFIILSATREGVYSVKIDLPFISYNSLNYMSSWNENLTINLEFTVETTDEDLIINPETSTIEAIDDSLENSLPDNIEDGKVDPSATPEDSVIDTPVEAPVDISVDIPVDTPVDTPVETLQEVNETP